MVGTAGLTAMLKWLQVAQCCIFQIQNSKCFRFGRTRYDDTLTSPIREQQVFWGRFESERAVTWSLGASLLKVEKGFDCLALKKKKCMWLALFHRAGCLPIGSQRSALSTAASRMQLAAARCRTALARVNEAWEQDVQSEKRKKKSTDRCLILRSSKRVKNKQQL